MAYSLYDSTTESLIQRTIEGIQRMISIRNNTQGGNEKGITMTKEVMALV
jgi:hypothetical protein